jgi:uncharacterized protein YbjT (DUF2867 family)
VTDSAPQGPPLPPPPPETQEISPDDLARMIAASAVPAPGIAPGGLPGGGALRRKLLAAILIAAIGIGASIMSCIGQSFSYRQARAMEGIEQQLKEIRASCTAAPHEVAR